MHSSKRSSTRCSVDAGAIGTTCLSAGPPNSPCQTDAPVVHYPSGTILAASVASPGPHSAVKNALKIAPFSCNLSPLESPLLQVLILNGLISLRINTYEKSGEGWGGPQV